MTALGSYECYVCGGEFQKGRSDEAAIAEMRATWQPHQGDDDLGTVCDDCFRRVLAWAKSNAPEILR